MVAGGEWSVVGRVAGHTGHATAGHTSADTGADAVSRVRRDGMPIMRRLTNPTIGEREVPAALLDRHHLIRNGQIRLADKGFAATTSSDP